jgi:membrane protease YdiL (CAAX protease family)
LIAWCVIAAVAGFVVWQNSKPHVGAKKTAENRLVGTIVDWQVRYLVGAARMFPAQQTEQFAAGAQIDSGPIEQRLRSVVVVGELIGTKAAVEKLQSLEKALDGRHGSPADRQAVESLARLYGDLAEGKTTLPSLAPADRQRIADQLGWSGKLALHPAGGAEADVRETLLAEARRTIVVSLIVFSAFGLLALAGLVVLVTIVLVLLIRPKSRAIAAPTPRGGIYAETFAAWMALYTALSYAVAWLPVGQNRLLLAAAVMLTSLAALAWPVFRGVAWRQVRDDIGLRGGRRPLVELLLGLVAYLAAMPLAIAGLILIVAIMAIERQGAGGAGLELGREMPSHPIVGWLLDADWWQKLQVFFLASVMAPLVEETMFRGVLHRHLRDATSRFGFAASVLTSGLAVSFLFAVIHPQGLLATPLLMALALAFTLAREWRGTLLPAMLAHGVNNLLATWVLISLS